MNDIMIDLETLGNTSNAAIMTIGACRFDIATGEIGPTLHIGVSPIIDNHTTRDEYGDIDPDTVLFWMKQAVSAKSAIIETLRDNIEPLDVALQIMDEVLKIGKTDSLWANGATFDLVILRNAYRRNRLKCPWDYWQERDVRTIVDLGRRLHEFNPKKEMPFIGTEHNALHDAIHQARYVSAIFQRMN